MAESALSKLDLRQKKFVVSFCTVGSGAYLDQLKAYEKAGYAKAKFSAGTAGRGVLSNANALFNKPLIQAAVKECLPRVAFDHIFVRQEWRDLYDEAKKQGDLKQRDSILKEMGKIEGLYAIEKKVEDTAVKDKTASQAEEAQRMWKEQMERMSSTAELKDKQKVS